MIGRSNLMLHLIIQKKMFFSVVIAVARKTDFSFEKKIAISS